MATKTWTGGTGTWDSTTGTHWSGGTAPVNGDAIVFDGTSGGGVVTADATISGMSFLSITCGAFTGTLTFAVNNPNLTITSSFSISGAGTRTINLGSGTFTFTGTGTVLDVGTITALTPVFGNVTLNLVTNAAYSGQTGINGGGQTYGTINLVGTNANGNAFNINNSGTTYGTMNITGPAIVCFSANTTITNAVNWTGTNAAPISLTTPISFGTISVTLSSAGGAATWTAIRGLTFVTNSITATNSFNLGGNTNATITNPSAGGSGGGIIGS